MNYHGQDLVLPKEREICSTQGYDVSDEFLGGGNMGRVFVAEPTLEKIESSDRLMLACPEDGRLKVAIKIVYADVGAIGLNSLAKYIPGEISNLDSAYGQTNIIHLLDVFVGCKRVFIVMEFAAEGDFHDLFCRHIAALDPGKKYMEEDVARKYFFEMVKGVKQLHDRGIAHRDIKPENFFVTESGQVKLGDLGLSICQKEPELEGSELCQNDAAMTFCGSWAYVAPEVYFKPKSFYDPFKADMWSLGVLLFLMVNGTTPFTATSKEQLRVQFARANQRRLRFRNGLSLGCHLLINRLIKRCPTKRASIREIFKDPWLAGHKKSATSCNWSPGLAREIAAIKRNLTFQYQVESAKNYLGRRKKLLMERLDFLVKSGTSQKCLSDAKIRIRLPQQGASGESVDEIWRIETCQDHFAALDADPLEGVVPHQKQERREAGRSSRAWCEGDTAYEQHKGEVQVFPLHIQGDVAKCVEISKGGNASKSKTRKYTNRTNIPLPKYLAKGMGWKVVMGRAASRHQMKRGGNMLKLNRKKDCEFSKRRYTDKTGIPLPKYLVKVMDKKGLREHSGIKKSKAAGIALQRKYTNISKIPPPKVIAARFNTTKKSHIAKGKRKNTSKQPDLRKGQTHNGKVQRKTRDTEQESTLKKNGLAPTFLPRKRLSERPSLIPPRMLRKDYPSASCRQLPPTVRNVDIRRFITLEQKRSIPKLFEQLKRGYMQQMDMIQINRPRKEKQVKQLRNQPAVDGVSKHKRIKNYPQYSQTKIPKGPAPTKKSLPGNKNNIATRYAGLLKITEFLHLPRNPTKEDATNINGYFAIKCSSANFAEQAQASGDNEVMPRSKKGAGFATVKGAILPPVNKEVINAPPGRSRSFLSRIASKLKPKKSVRFLRGNRVGPVRVAEPAHSDVANKGNIRAKSSRVEPNRSKDEVSRRKTNAASLSGWKSPEICVATCKPRNKTSVPNDARGPAYQRRSSRSQVTSNFTSQKSEKKVRKNFAYGRPLQVQTTEPTGDRNVKRAAAIPKKKKRGKRSSPDVTEKSRAGWKSPEFFFPRFAPRMKSTPQESIAMDDAGYLERFEEDNSPNRVKFDGWKSPEIFFRERTQHTRVNPPETIQVEDYDNTSLCPIESQTASTAHSYFTSRPIVGNGKTEDTIDYEQTVSPRKKRSFLSRVASCIMPRQREKFMRKKKAAESAIQDSIASNMERNNDHSTNIIPVLTDTKKLGKPLRDGNAKVKPSKRWKSPVLFFPKIKPNERPKINEMSNEAFSEQPNGWKSPELFFPQIARSITTNQQATDEMSINDYDEKCTGWKSPEIYFPEIPPSNLSNRQNTVKVSNELEPSLPQINPSNIDNGSRKEAILRRLNRLRGKRFKD